MKKVFTLIIACIMMLSLSTMTVFADSVLYENTFDSMEDLDDGWSYGHAGAASQNKVVDGQLFLGNPTNWTLDLVDANYNEVFTDAVYEFDFKTEKLDVYGGFGLRLPVDGTKPDLFGGARAGAAGTDVGYGISVDMYSAAHKEKIVIAFNNGDMTQSPFAELDVPSGFDVTVMNKITVIDSGDQIIIKLAGNTIATLKFSGLAEDAYTAVEILDANGASVKKFDNVTVLSEGGIGFYQRNNPTYVDNLKISSISGYEGGNTPGENTPTPSVPTAQPGTPATGDASMLAIAAVVILAASVLITMKKKSTIK